MIIHNVMEDIVSDEVNKLFDEAEQKKEDWVTCTCIQCRHDVMCYVLNRIKPRYIKSGRGLAHFLNFTKDERDQIATDNGPDVGWYAESAIYKTPACCRNGRSGNRRPLFQFSCNYGKGFKRK